MAVSRLAPDAARMITGGTILHRRRLPHLWVDLRRRRACERGSDLPLILILFGAVGAAAAVGVLRLFLGPTLLAAGYELIREWNSVDGRQPETRK
jgi:hypothetical protein